MESLYRFIDIAKAESKGTVKPVQESEKVKATPINEQVSFGLELSRRADQRVAEEKPMEFDKPQKFFIF